MAVKYFSDFNDDDGRFWHAVIHDQNYGGSSPLEFTVGADGFVLDYDGSDTNRSQTIQSSTVDLSYIIQNNNDAGLLSDIAGSAEGRYQLEIYSGGASYSAGHLYWRGVILADVSTIQDEAYPQEFRIKAIDDLAGLRDVQFDTGSTGYSSLSGIVANALNKMRVWDITNDTHRFTVVSYLNVVDYGGTYRNPWTAAQLNYATFVDDSRFPNEYKKTYEVLDGILSGLGMRMYWRASTNVAVDSGFFVDSLNAQEYSPIQYSFTDFNNVATASSSLGYRQQITLDSANVHRLRGWSKGYLNPLLEVSRDFKYGSSPFVVDHEYSGNDLTHNWHNGTYDAVLMPAPTILYQEDSLISFRFKVIANHDEGNPNDQEFDGFTKRAGRLRIRAKLRFGQYYAERSINNEGTTGVYVTDGGAQAPVVTFSENAASWSTSSSNTIDFYTPPLIWTDNESQTFQMGIDLPPLPADLTSEICTVSYEIRPLASTGSVSAYQAAIGQLFDGNPANILKATVYPTDIFESAGATVTFKATNSNTDAREIKALQQVFFSDLLGTRGGGLFVYQNGQRTQPNEWQSPTNVGADLNLHNLVAKEWLEGQSTNIRKMTGTVRVSDTSIDGLSMADTVTHESVKYNIQKINFVATRGLYELDLLELTNGGTVTNPTEGFSDGYDNVINDPSRPAVSPVEVVVGEIQEKTDNITVSQAVNLDTLETNQSNILTVLKTSFTNDGAGLYSDSGKSTGASHMSLTSTTAKMQAGGGNTLIDLTETSPGIIALAVQVGTSPNEISSTALTLQGTTGSQLPNIIFNGNFSGIAISDLDDVTVSGIQTNQVLAWNGNNFVPVNQGGGGGSADTTELELKTIFLEQ